MKIKNTSANGPSIEMVYVPPGAFLMGGGDQRHEHPLPHYDDIGFRAVLVWPAREGREPPK